MNNLITKIEGFKDALLDRYNELAFVQNIPDVQAYGNEWKLLGEMCEAENRPALAAMCFSRASWYLGQPVGEYVRLTDGPFSELIPVESV